MYILMHLFLSIIVVLVICIIVYTVNQVQGESFEVIQIAKQTVGLRGKNGKTLTADEELMSDGWRKYKGLTLVCNEEPKKYVFPIGNPKWDIPKLKRETTGRNIGFMKLAPGTSEDAYGFTKFPEASCYWAYNPFADVWIKPSADITLPKLVSDILSR